MKEEIFLVSRKVFVGEKKILDEERKFLDGEEKKFGGGSSGRSSLIAGEEKMVEKRNFLEKREYRRYYNFPRGPRGYSFPQSTFSAMIQKRRH